MIIVPFILLSWYAFRKDYATGIVQVIIFIPMLIATYFIKTKMNKRNTAKEKKKENKGFPYKSKINQDENKKI